MGSHWNDFLLFVLLLEWRISLSTENSPTENEILIEMEYVVNISQCLSEDASTCSLRIKMNK